MRQAIILTRADLAAIQAGMGLDLTMGGETVTLLFDGGKRRAAAAAPAPSSNGHGAYLPKYAALQRWRKDPANARKIRAMQLKGVRAMHAANKRRKKQEARDA